LAYINDVLVKSKNHGDLLDDLKETFNNLRKYKMCLILKKCVFDVSSGKLLGYTVSTPTRRRWKPLNNCNHFKPEEKSRS
jgi:hypothetical protein